MKLKIFYYASRKDAMFVSQSIILFHSEKLDRFPQDLF